MHHSSPAGAAVLHLGSGDPAPQQQPGWAPQPPIARASTGSFQLPQPAQPMVGLAVPPEAGGGAFSSSSSSSGAFPGALPPGAGASSQLLQRRHSAFNTRSPGDDCGAVGPLGRAGSGVGAGGGGGAATAGLPINFSHSRKGRGGGGRLSCLCAAFLLVAFLAAATLCAMIAKTSRNHRALVDHHYTVRAVARVVPIMAFLCLTATGPRPESGAGAVRHWRTRSSSFQRLPT